VNINNYIRNRLIPLKVIPNSSQTKLIEEHGQLKLYLKSIPEKDKANKELIKFFKKEYNLQVEIKSGKKSRNKVINMRESVSPRLKRRGLN
jgi:uncharacterized protein (TIGR00251 family)